MRLSLTSFMHETADCILHRPRKSNVARCSGKIKISQDADTCWLHLASYPSRSRRGGAERAVL